MRWLKTKSDALFRKGKSGILSFFTLCKKINSLCGCGGRIQGQSFFSERLIRRQSPVSIGKDFLLGKMARGLFKRERGKRSYLAERVGTGF
jgi:hypothetical protein